MDDFSIKNPKQSTSPIGIIAGGGDFPVVVSGGHVLTVDAAEGTDAMLERVANLRTGNRVSSPGGILVKRPNPNQDLRVDMPVIGSMAVEKVAKAGLSGIVVEANNALCHDHMEVIRRADKLGIFIEGKKTQKFCV